MRRLLAWLKNRGVQALCVTFGVGSNAPAEQLWTPIAVSTEDLPEFVRGAVLSGWFAFGRVDLHIYDAAKLVMTSDVTFRCDYLKAVFTFCH